MQRLTITAAPLLAALLALAACGGREGAETEPRGISVSTDRPAELVQARGDEAASPVAGGDTSSAGAIDLPAEAPRGPSAGGAATTPAAPPTTPPAAPAGSAQERAEEILRRVERTAAGIRSLEADFVQSLTVPLLNQSQQSAGRLYQRKPDRFLMRFTQPAGDIIVADGRHFWLYYPSSDRTQVIRTSIEQGGEQADFQREFVSNPTARYVATLAGEESVAGRRTWMLTLVPRRESPYRLLKVWVDQEDSYIRRFEITEQNESVRRVELRNLRVNGTLSDALFSFTPPAGTQVIDQ